MSLPDRYVTLATNHPFRRFPAAALAAAALVALLPHGTVRAASPGEVSVQTATPPPPQVEVVPPAPGPAYFWIAGYWRWEGGAHVWVPGYWEAAQPGRRWVPAHWVASGAASRYVPGH